MLSRHKNFEDLVIYQQSHELAKQVYQLTNTSLFRHDRGLKDQIRRASVSILSNIAEGFERGSNVEFIQFLYISKGSCGEVRAQLSLARDLKYVDSGIANELIASCRKISGMLANTITSLKSSEYRGTKYKVVRRDRTLEWKKFLEEFQRETKAKKAQEAQGAQEDQR